MKCVEVENGVRVEGVCDLDLAQTLDCGQSFRWTEREDGSFEGIAFGKCVTVRLENNTLYIENTTKEDFEKIWYDYFDLSLDYGKIRDEIKIGRAHV